MSAAQQIFTSSKAKGGGNLNEGDLYIKFCDPDSGGTTDEAGWKVHT
jgi:hypothetical protein